MQQTGQYLRATAPSLPDATPSYSYPAGPSSYGSAASPYVTASSYYGPSLSDPAYSTNAPSYAPESAPYSPLPSALESVPSSNCNLNKPNFYSTEGSSLDKFFSYDGSSTPATTISHQPTSQVTSFATAAQSCGGVGYHSLSGSETYGHTQHGLLQSVGLSYDNIGNRDEVGGFFSLGQGHGRVGHPGAFGRPYYEQTGGFGQGPDNGAYENARPGEVYAYDAGRTEQYGVNNTLGASCGSFESPHRSSTSSSGSFVTLGDTGSSKITRPALEADTGDRVGGIQKYRVKLLPDSNLGDGPMDVSCQIGLDGVRMFVPNTNNLVRAYPLETISKWEVSEPSIFIFWAKSAVDVEPQRIRLQADSYTTNAFLDSLTAACVQFSEMVSQVDTSKESKGPDQSTEKKKLSFPDWVSLRARLTTQEEKQHWVPDEAVKKCTSCNTDFGAFMRRHHCRNCGDIFCDKCTQGRIALTSDEDAQSVRVCDGCLAEVTQHLFNLKASTKIPLQQTHKDLAKKLQEEMDRNAARRSSTSNPSSNSEQEKSAQSSVRSCSVCGSISFLCGSNTQCQSCGADYCGQSSENGGQATNPDSYALYGPPHLWPTQSNHEGSGKQVQEVACPTCTVHLQVEVPSFGTETVECGVCQHPFLVECTLKAG